MLFDRSVVQSACRRLLGSLLLSILPVSIVQSACRRLLVSIVVVRIAGSTGVSVSILLSLFLLLVVPVLFLYFGIPRTPAFSFCDARSHRNFIPVMHSSSSGANGTPAVSTASLCHTDGHSDTVGSSSPMDGHNGTVHHSCNLHSCGLSTAAPCPLYHINPVLTDSRIIPMATLALSVHLVAADQHPDLLARLQFMLLGWPQWRCPLPVPVVAKVALPLQ
jgi:hypothetical protein